MSKERRGLALFFTLGVSLADWQAGGYLEREIAYYRRLSREIGPVTFMTYGGEEDLKLAENFSDIRILNNPDRIPPETFARRASDIYKDQLRETAIVKSNQIKGAQAAIRASLTSGASAVVRCGYLLSRFVSNRPVSNRMRFGLWRRELALFHQARHIFLPTNEDAQYARRWYALPSDKVKVIPNFVDPDLFAPKEDVACEPGLICFVGRLEPQKNLLALVEAVSGIKGARLRLIGTGSQKEQLLVLAKEKNVPIEIIDWVPHVNLPRYLAEGEVFVLPSLYEGLPKSLIEAMTAGVPVVATKVHGSESLIKHLRTGWLCEDTSVASLREGLQTLLRDSSLRSQIGRAAREYAVEHFSLEKVVAREVSIYKESGLV